MPANKLPKQVKRSDLGRLASIYRENGHSNRQIAAALEVSEGTIRNALKEAGWVAPNKRLIVQLDSQQERVVSPDFHVLTPAHLKGDVAIFSDIHLPLTDYRLLDTACREAVELGIKTLILPGDYLHMDSMSRHEEKQRNAGLPREIKEAKRVMGHLLEIFDDIYLTRGNHEENWVRTLKYSQSLSESLRLFFEDERVKLAEGDHVYVDTDEGKWLICHTNQYSRVQLTVPGKLSLIEECHVWAGHRHHHAIGFSESGRRLVEAGCFAESRITEYKHRFKNTFPKWQKGYGFLIGGIPYLPLLTPDPRRLKK